MSRISAWLDEREKEGLDVSEVPLPGELSYDEAPDETIFFREIKPCGILCTEDHPFSTVERFGDWYLARGRQKGGDAHAPGKEWRLFTRNRELALETARARLA